ncbi:hypothetical protein GA0070624_6747 [Micromonospora rhizosphaerae]|uniref:Uncharacterized protein n=1 Tax=Micromonospora rhizosphaerae TaxID=568872 RepID=A0A1C6TDV4_9ACTN|nr:hypothetical protein [Micromonospora rhizosphaerae]SCL39954.1 hypothetical protein GA0070624_6747 [Micromonospora rhizosphaerae]
MRSRRSRLALTALVALAALAGCERGGESAGKPSGTGPEPVASSPADAAVPAPSCPPANQYGSGLAEVGGTPGVFWALLFLEGGELRVGKPTKIAFRMTGAGDLTLRAEGPEGTTAEPIEVIGHTGGSTWQRPGDEWGSQWTFPTAGCWTIRADRTDGTRGAVTLRAG